MPMCFSSNSIGNMWGGGPLLDPPAPSAVTCSDIIPVRRYTAVGEAALYELLATVCWKLSVVNLSAGQLWWTTYPQLVKFYSKPFFCNRLSISPGAGASSPRLLLQALNLKPYA